MGESRHGFDWDSANTKKCQKHGVSIAEIEFLFMHDPPVYPDLEHSEAESRYLAVGKNNVGRYIAVVFTYRQHEEAVIVRPISARYMHRKEISRYTSV